MDLNLAFLSCRLSENKKTLKKYKESTGFEPVHRLRRLAGFRVQCITTLPTLHEDILRVNLGKCKCFFKKTNIKEKANSPSLLKRSVATKVTTDFFDFIFPLIKRDVVQDIQLSRLHHWFFR